MANFEVGGTSTGQKDGNLLAIEYSLLDIQVDTSFGLNAKFVNETVEPNSVVSVSVDLYSDAKGAVLSVEGQPPVLLTDANESYPEIANLLNSTLARTYDNSKSHLSGDELGAFRGSVQKAFDDLGTPYDLNHDANSDVISFKFGDSSVEIDFSKGLDTAQVHYTNADFQTDVSFPVAEGFTDITSMSHDKIFPNTLKAALHEAAEIYREQATADNFDSDVIRVLNKAHDSVSITDLWGGDIGKTQEPVPVEAPAFGR